MTTDGPAGADPSAAVPDDPEQLKQDIERTREQLGETVEALVAKTDVKAQARERAGQLTQTLKEKTAQAKEQTTARVGQARGQLAGKTADAKSAAQQKAGALDPAKNQLQARAAAVGGAVRNATPEPVQRTAQQVTQRVSAVATPRQGLIAAAGAVALVVGFIVIRRRRRR